jgi:hypothetical protein
VDGNVLAGADFAELIAGVVLHQEDAGVGHVVGVNKLAAEDPVPQAATVGRPSSFASWKRRISAGRTWLFIEW